MVERIRERCHLLRMIGKAKKPPSRAIQRWDTEGGASPNGPQQEPRKKRPKPKKDEEPFSGDFTENPGSVGEMHVSYESRKKRPRDANQLAKSIVDIATGKDEDREPTPEEQGKDPAAVSLGRRGGLKGGKARADSLTAEQRAEIARLAAQARWKKAD